MLLCLPFLIWAGAIARTPPINIGCTLLLLPFYALTYGVWGLASLALWERRVESRQVFIRSFFVGLVILSALFYLPLNPVAFVLALLSRQELPPLLLFGWQWSGRCSSSDLSYSAWRFGLCRPSLGACTGADVLSSMTDNLKSKFAELIGWERRKRREEILVLAVLRRASIGPRARAAARSFADKLAALACAGGPVRCARAVFSSIAGAGRRPDERARGGFVGQDARLSRSARSPPGSCRRATRPAQRRSWFSNKPKKNFVRSNRARSSRAGRLAGVSRAAAVRSVDYRAVAGFRPLE